MSYSIQCIWNGYKPRKNGTSSLFNQCYLSGLGGIECRRTFLLSIITYVGYYVVCSIINCITIITYACTVVKQTYVGYNSCRRVTLNAKQKAVSQFYH